ncbi:class I SAM-dependent methyltransferase [Nitrincola alkalilacustris]|uniref:class I SAM-dependent methyltransferase n=1 Tax=Nitrincola alkalilacustris TaxID=1571224 RepID=UPI001456885C|nr:methyltransferase [Nitrincola alkalilacustris]
MNPIDAATSALYQQLAGITEPALWLADENITTPLPPANPAIEVVSNRHDLASALHHAGWQTTFNDFDLSAFSDGQFNSLLYRISKEKALVHHIINQSFRLLQESGALILIGDKNEGIKTFARKAAQHLGGTLREQKLAGNLWQCTLTRADNTFGKQPLDDQNYTQLRPIVAGEMHFISKPGLYGWQKIDQGSAYLVAQLPAMIKQPLPLHGSLLDLGCGFGYLTLATAGPDTQVICTDNNAAALIACRANLDLAGLQGTVLASDAGDCLNEQVDILLCNPPFHAGFSTAGDLTDKFLAATARLLNPDGIACFVVNLHIPLERKAQKWFDRVDLHSDNGHFKLITLRKPRTNR